MRLVPWILAAVIVAPLPGPAADPSPASDVERLAASRATWEKARDAAHGNYSYEVLQVFLMSRQTTRIVVRDGKVVERSFEQLVAQPGLLGGPADTPAQAWTEKGADVGTHGDGAAPARTVDELYDEAAKVLAAPRDEFRERSLGIDDRGLLHHCFERDTRIADDVPLEGVPPFQITIDAP